ncbi:CpsB/CapC family capsule biosynthesis tyrosine phosphatase [Haliscomenobacter sp.]|uniref:tyrosine-protein phosphatase n=1 Tax=Haliscomenobacter sp. TaxID=2717303 RepID=UPI0033652090
MFGNLFSRTQKKDEIPPQDFSVLNTDMHSHLIPGIDDGAKTLEESLELVRGLIKLGFSGAITTPHVMGDYYPNNGAIISSGCITLQEAIRREGLNFRLEASAEYNIDSYTAELFEQGDILFMPGKRILVELSFFAPPPDLENRIFQLRIKGYYPILAHPERYSYYMGSRSDIERICDLGCDLQVNILSLAGYYGNSIAKWAKTLVEAGMVSYLGTDMHHIRHLKALEDALKHKDILRLLQRYSFKNKDLFNE